MASDLDHLQMAQARSHSWGRKVSNVRICTADDGRSCIHGGETYTPRAETGRADGYGSRSRKSGPDAQADGRDSAACRGFSSSSSGSSRAWASCTRSSCKTRSTWCPPRLLRHLRWNCPVYWLMRGFSMRCATRIAWASSPLAVLRGCQPTALLSPPLAAASRHRLLKSRAEGELQSQGDGGALTRLGGPEGLASFESAAGSGSLGVLSTQVRTSTGRQPNWARSLSQHCSAVNASLQLMRRQPLCRIRASSCPRKNTPSVCLSDGGLLHCRTASTRTPTLSQLAEASRAATRAASTSATPCRWTCVPLPAPLLMLIRRSPCSKCWAG